VRSEQLGRNRASVGSVQAINLRRRRIYKESKKSIIAWCLGISQQEYGVDTIREIVNVLLLKGNIGREGAGPCPIRGHSNVQGNRTCGIHNRPPESWLAKMDAACGIKSPREYGYDTVGTIEAMMSGDVKVFMGMGGNFASARQIPSAHLKRCESAYLLFRSARN